MCFWVDPPAEVTWFCMVRLNFPPCRKITLGAGLGKAGLSRLGLWCYHHQSIGDKQLLGQQGDILKYSYAWTKYRTPALCVGLSRLILQNVVHFIGTTLQTFSLANYLGVVGLAQCHLIYPHTFCMFNTFPGGTSYFASSSQSIDNPRGIPLLNFQLKVCVEVPPPPKGFCEEQNILQVHCFTFGS